MKLLLFRLILFLIVIIGFEVIGYAAMWYDSGYDMAANKSYFQIRAMLIGDQRPEHYPRYLSLPYLGYIQYPGYKSHGIIQNNQDGYRGRRVPMVRTDRLRVLCMGGSTTYGFAVDSPAQAYPARLEALLGAYIAQDSLLSRRFNGAEVINAGLEAGTSAEELQQYLFKYRYYTPDIVIIHSGVNDALITGRPSSDFQLDYTHYRRLNFHLEPLTTPARWLLKSYFISFISIRLFYDNFAYNGQSGRECFSRQQYQHFCRWSDVNLDSMIRKGQYDFLPFYRNSKTLFSSIIQDSAVLVVLPNALNKNEKFVVSNKEYAAATALNASLSKSLSDRLGGVYIPFAFDSIRDPAMWVDDCHLTASGEQNKAEIVFRGLQNTLSHLAQSVH